MMQLSEDRIRGLAKQIAKELIAGKAVKAPAGVADLTQIVADALHNDQDTEAKIEAEATAILKKQRNLPPIGTPEYQAEFIKAKQTLAVRKGFVL